MDDIVLADDGCRLWTARSGHGRPLILCHGGPGLWDSFADVAALLDRAARVVRWDQRGCGRSDRRGPYTVTRSVADLDAIRRDLGAERVDLLGHSWGAHLALRYALAHPQHVRRLVYVSGTGIDADRSWQSGYRDGLRDRLGEHLPRWQELRARSRTPAEDRELAVLQWTADYADPAAALGHAEAAATPWLGINDECNAAVNAEVAQYLAGTDVVALCRGLGVPALIIDGDRDIRPRAAVDSLCRALAGSRRVTIAGAGHLPWIEDAAAFRAAVTEFLGQRPLLGVADRFLA